MADGKWMMAHVRRTICLLPFAIFHLPCCLAFAADVRNELPAPHSLQAVVLKETVTLSWQWQAPEELPVFLEFGYEIKRQDGKTFQVTGTTFADNALFPGTYRYLVRARGTAKQKGKRVTYVSDWAGPASGDVLAACPRPPTLDLSVEPTQKRYASIPTLRFHIQGHASVPRGCTLGAVAYHLDTGTGIVHSGPLSADAQGHFDAFINAFGPEDEIPSGLVSFAISAAAADDAGPATSNVFTVDVELENPFAPHTP